MEKMLEQILEEDFEGGRGTLEFSDSEITLILPPGTVYEGTFAVYANGEGRTCGYVTSTDARMECLTAEFQGAEDYISFRFHGEHLKAGEEVQGEFHIVSNRGEYIMPFAVLADAEAVTSSAGEIRDLFQFANLAKENWQEALRLFYSAPFAGLIKELAAKAGQEGNRSGLYEIYRGLSAIPGNAHNMEEFLIMTGQKVRAEYLTGEKEIFLTNPVGVAEEELSVIRNGWGYTRLRVSTEGSFLFTEKDILNENDFLGNRCRIPVYINGLQLHCGRNFGRILISGDFQTIVVPVTVRVGEENNAAAGVRRERKRIIVQLMKLYQDNRMKKISAHTWQKESGALVERLVLMNDKDALARLLQAQLLITRERFHEANWMLEHSLELIEQKSGDDAALYAASYAYYLYLTTLLKPDAWYLRQTAEELEQLYKRNSDCWQIAWLLLFLSPEYNRKPAARWEFLEKQFEKGCTSPVMYLEAVQLLNQDPALLRTLGRYEIQVLSYGSRKGILSEQLSEQMLYLAGRMKEFSPVLLRILISCYEKKNNADVLREICSQLMKGSLTGPRAFPWYERGIEQELRLTKLYEYYLMSFDTESGRELSRKALFYFSYQTDLDYEHTAFLYRYVVSRREENRELFETYRQRIERFVLEQIKKEHINRDLAWLYQELLTPELFEEQMAKSLTGLLFACSIKTEDAGICRAVCIRPGLEQMSFYPAGGSSAWVALYGEGDVVLLEDREGNRYTSAERCRIEKLMDPEPFLGLTCFYALGGEAQKDIGGLILGEGRREELFAESSRLLAFAGYVWDRAEKEKPSSEELYCGRLLAGSSSVSGARRQKALIEVLQCYEAQGDVYHLDNMLGQAKPEGLDRDGRSALAEILMTRQKLDKAFKWAAEYGFDLLEAKSLKRLISCRTEQVNFQKDETLLQAAACAFRRGEYDGNILLYLSLYFDGLTQEMTAVWRASVSYGADSTKLCERLLCQLLFTGTAQEDRTELFRQYLCGEPQRPLELAFLTQCASDYLIGGIMPDDLMIQEIGRLYEAGEEMPVLLKIAFLSYYAEEGRKCPEDMSSLVGIFLREMQKNGIYLEFFRRLPADGQLLDILQDKTLVEYRSAYGTKAMISYRICQSEKAGEEFRKEEMFRVCRGIFSSSFVLFFGERLQYYIEQEIEGRMVKVAEGELRKEESPSDAPECRYEAINDLLLANSLEDYETLDHLLERYYHKEYLGERLFMRR